MGLNSERISRLNKIKTSIVVITKAVDVNGMPKERLQRIQT